MSTHPTPRVPAPMQMIRRLLCLLRNRGECGLELDVIDHQVAREETAVKIATGEAQTIEQRLATARHDLNQAMDDGVVTLEEASQLARELIDTAGKAHRHTTTLQALT